MFALKQISTGKIVTAYVIVDSGDYRPYVEWTLGTDPADVIYAKAYRSDLESVLNFDKSVASGSFDNPYVGDLNRLDLEIVELTLKS